MSVIWETTNFLNLFQLCGVNYAQKKTNGRAPSLWLDPFFRSVVGKLCSTNSGRSPNQCPDSWFWIMLLAKFGFDKCHHPHRYIAIYGGKVLLGTLCREIYAVQPLSLRCDPLRPRHAAVSLMYMSESGLSNPMLGSDLLSPGFEKDLSNPDLANG